MDSERIYDLAETVMINVMTVIVYAGVTPVMSDDDELGESYCRLVGEQVCNLLVSGKTTLSEANVVAHVLGDYISKSSGGTTPLTKEFVDNSLENIDKKQKEYQAKYGA